jgi:hypothetical protein
MEPIGDTTRVCPACKLLQWEEDGKTHSRVPVRVTGEQDNPQLPDDDFPGAEKAEPDQADQQNVREYPILVPHADYGDAECCGIVMPVRNGEYVQLQDIPAQNNQMPVDLMCNECGAVIASVPAGEAEQTLLRMAMSGGVCSETCPLCGELNVFPGWTAMEAFTCRFCGNGVKVERPVL